MAEEKSKYAGQFFEVVQHIGGANPGDLYAPSEIVARDKELKYSTDASIEALLNGWIKPAKEGKNG